MTFHFSIQMLSFNLLNLAVSVRETISLPSAKITSLEVIVLLQPLLSVLFLFLSHQLWSF